MPHEVKLLLDVLPIDDQDCTTSIPKATSAEQKSHEGDVCVICIDPIGTLTEAVDPFKCTTIVHWYHSNCIKELKRHSVASASVKCLLCMAPLKPISFAEIGQIEKDWDRVAALSSYSRTDLDNHAIQVLGIIESMNDDRCRLAALNLLSLRQILTIHDAMFKIIERLDDVCYIECLLELLPRETLALHHDAMFKIIERLDDAYYIKNILQLLPPETLALHHDAIFKIIERLDDAYDIKKILQLLPPETLALHHDAISTIIGRLNDS